MSKLRNVSKKLLQVLGREPTIEETAPAAGISEQATRRVLKISWYPICLDRAGGESVDSIFGEFIEDDSADCDVDVVRENPLSRRRRNEGG